MADPAQTCECVPYEVLRCCGSINGISVAQPHCQNLPDGRVVNNPAYDNVTGKSYWSYKFLTDCDSDTRGISNILIPICSAISAENIIVNEKIDGCDDFSPVDFELITDDPNFGVAPEGFQWLKIETDDRFDKGVCVEYRLDIVGDFPVAVESIYVKAATTLLTFDCDDGFFVPECNPQGTLTISKDCGYIIDNNKTTLKYTLKVSNIGNATLQNVQFRDVLIVPTQLSFGNIQIQPSTLSASSVLPGEIIISGNLGVLNPSEVKNITYDIPITSVASAGIYTINNTARVSASGTEATATCPLTLNVSQLLTTTCCRLTAANTGEFQLGLSTVGQSPATTVDVVDNIFIPGGVTLQFHSFDGCVATFANTSEQVPVNTDIVGPLRIRIACDNITVPAGGIIQKKINFSVVSSSSFGTAPIQNTVESVTPTLPDQQVFLGAGILPVEADVAVELALNCTTPCAVEFDL